MTWFIEENEYKKDHIERNGSKFLQGNGYMGYRGTLEEYSREQLAACNLSGVYDKVGNAWREPVNAPNGLYTKLFCNGSPMSVLDGNVVEHRQHLDLKTAVHKRETVFAGPSGNLVTVKSERFLGLSDVHLMCMRFTFKARGKCSITLETGIDGDVWDINGPHLKNFKAVTKHGLIILNAKTHESNCTVTVAEAIKCDFDPAHETVSGKKSVVRRFSVQARPSMEYTFFKYVSVFTGKDGVTSPAEAATDSCRAALETGYDGLLEINRRIWDERWERSDVRIDGDEEAQLALRYSIYHLLSIAPIHTGRASIPARGLSGQMYKGAIFWDTEMFMLPFFLYTNPDIARNLVNYRVDTLGGARDKALEYGFRGAFYAWESQDGGSEACTLFNITDVFTGRPMRTYFRDKQIHISADVVYGIWQYYVLTGDESILLDGGAETILECARFFYSWSYFSKDRNRYEILDVTGPDEYHERVANNAYTNMMVRHTLDVAVQVAALLRRKHPAAYDALIRKLSFQDDLKNIEDMRKLLFVPKPDAQTGIIEQFSGYSRLEDVSLKALKERVLNPNEYLGGGNGIAATTKILKQADVVLMLNLFKDRYSQEVKKANWEYYEPRTEHGSSLSACVYAMLASDTGNPDWGYGYFMKTASIDMAGEAKQYVGTLYIGGTHPAANGGAWMAAVLGFAGLGFNDGMVSVAPKLPATWEKITFHIVVRGQKFSIEAGKSGVKVCSAAENTADVLFRICGELWECRVGQVIYVT